jgi:4-hydroxy-4-methyl-2-oxoglutarate aldolase
MNMNDPVDGIAALAIRFKKLGTASLSDALDKLGIAGVCLGLHPVSRSSSIAGPAFTVRMLPQGRTAKSVGDYIDEVKPGHVVAIDNAGRLDATVWGDLLTSVASRNGLAGTVIDGVCRDTDRCLELRYPVYARTYTMRTGKDRVAAEAYNESIQLCGVRVEAGDWLVGDADGLLAIPAEALKEVLEVGEGIAKVEDRIRAVIASGGRLDAARSSAGYHALQSKTDEPHGLAR